MAKIAIRILSFFYKELTEIYRQPKLVVSLIIGPFLILLMVGAGYESGRPDLRMLLVIPEEIQEQLPLADIRRIISANFNLAGVVSDEATALERLQAGQVNVVGIFPADVQEELLRGNRSSVEFKYDEINPYNEQWIRYLAYAQVSEVNRSLLLQATSQAQEEVEATLQLLNEASRTLARLQSGISTVQRADFRRLVRRLRQSLDLLIEAPLLVQGIIAQRSDVEQLRQEAFELRESLLELQQALDTHRLEEEQTNIRTIRTQVEELRETLELWKDLPPEAIISPLQWTYENVRGESLDAMIYYTPGVIMLILQHIAITLSALSLVRERMLGAYELYRIAPVSMLQILIGKYVGYALFLYVLAATLMGLTIWGLQAPFEGSVTEFIGLLSLVILSALGIGFLISVAAGSDTQAVQFSMLVLLLSIFFSGFVLPLEDFSAAVRAVGYLIPLTHGIMGLQEIMLRGGAVSPFSVTWLVILAAGTFCVVLITAQRQFRRAI